MTDDDRVFDLLCRHVRETALLASAEALLAWDERTMLPPQAAEYRAEQLTLLSGMIHRRRTDPHLGEWLGQLAESVLAKNPHSPAGATIRQLRRQYDKQVKLPASLVEELARTSSLAQNAWEKCRPLNDFKTFHPFLQKTFELKKAQAAALGPTDCLYDALLDDYEPEARTAEVAKVLAALRESLAPLVSEIAQSGKTAPVALLQRNFPVATQQRFVHEIGRQIGFDFERGRVDVTAHPFCTTTGPHDCRLTTRYDEQAFSEAFFGVLHEGGHGMYEQGLPTEHFGLPPGEAVSLGVHESQSRLWENFVGRGLAFWKHVYPMAQKVYPSLADVRLNDFYFALNDVRPSLVRVDADEATYNLHVMVRFELEQAALNGELSAAELPTAWREKYRDYLGITPPDDRDGVLQDVHWSAGLVGYFPTYTLGNLYAAQLFDRADADIGPLEEQFARGEFQPLLAWLRDKVHRHGQTFGATELIRNATGQSLSHEPLLRHLRGKLGPLYGI